MRPTDNHIVEQIKELKPNISGRLDQRTINDCFAVMNDPNFSARTTEPDPWRIIMKNKIAPAAIAAGILLVVGLLVWPTNPEKQLTSLSLLTQAHAAEQTFFSGREIVYLVNEFTLIPVAESTKFSKRLEELEKALTKNDIDKAGQKNIEALKAWFSYSWLPLYALGPDGQLKCIKVEPAGTDSCIVTEKIWYDPATGRFARILETDGKTIFANSFDGRNICTSYQNAGILNMQRQTAAAEFKIPKNPADFLGMGAGITGAFSRKEGYPPIIDVSEESIGQTPVRVYKMGFKDIEGRAATYYLFKVGTKDNIIHEIHCVVENKPSMILRRISTQSVAAADLSWDLQELADQKTSAENLPVVVTADIDKKNISIEQMVQTADFETYIFSANPAWTSGIQINSGPDEGSITSLMFNTVYTAADSRHVILTQMPSLNRYHAGVIKKMEEMGHPWLPGYTSPNGCRMYRSDKQGEEWWTGFAIKASGFEPVENRCGIIIETPSQTFLTLAVNGPVSDEEFHKLVDSLIPAREYQNR